MDIFEEKAGLHGLANTSHGKWSFANERWFALRGFTVVSIVLWRRDKDIYCDQCRGMIEMHDVLRQNSFEICNLF